jgi:UDP-N-acetylmuramoylalanine--D-glutamate ligase
MNLKSKKVSVIGLGISGYWASVLLNTAGALVYAMDTSCTEQLEKKAVQLKNKGIHVCLGRYNEDAINSSNLIVLSPGVKENSIPLGIACRKAIPIVSEIEIASWFCKGDIAAVTGTNGKTTITTLIGLMLKASGKSPLVCGNIGSAFSESVLSVKKKQPVVLELSSFQLNRIDGFSPRISIISNIARNHLDMHDCLEDYFNAKKNIYKNQLKSDFCLLNYDDPRLRQLKPKPRARILFYSVKTSVEGAYIEDNNLIVNPYGEKIRVCSLDEIKLKGRHNHSNILAAACCAYILGADPESMRTAIRDFSGLEHRFEHFCIIDNVQYIDDSKATTVDACAAALKNCSKKIILIAGGRDKGSDFSSIKELIAKKVKAVIAIGEAASKIKNAFSGVTKVYEACSMSSAVGLASSKAGFDDIVLLSPMCASFDMYSSFSERGMDFKRIVYRMRDKQQGLKPGGTASCDL